MFTPPTPEQLEAYLQEHTPREASPWAARMPLIVLGVSVGLLFVVEGVAMLVLPWLALGGVFVYLMARVRWARSLEQRATRAQELAMLRRYPEALRRAWQLLPGVVANPGLYVRTVALMAECLDRLKAYDAALTGYDKLLHHLPNDHPGALHLGVERAMAALSAERLADADDALRRLRGAIEPYAKTPLAAGYRLAQLAQQVRTHHYTDALAWADDLLAQLRPLGVEAGYGHALLALCYREARSGVDEARREEHTALWWGRATTLLPAAALVDRFPELTVLTEEPA